MRMARLALLDLNLKLLAFKTHSNYADGYDDA